MRKIWLLGFGLVMTNQFVWAGQCCKKSGGDSDIKREAICKANPLTFWQGSGSCPSGSTGVIGAVGNTVNNLGGGAVGNISNAVGNGVAGAINQVTGAGGGANQGFGCGSQQNENEAKALCQEMLKGEYDDCKYGVNLTIAGVAQWVKIKDIGPTCKVYAKRREQNQMNKDEAKEICNDVIRYNSHIKSCKVFRGNNCVNELLIAGGPIGVGIISGQATKWEPFKTINEPGRNFTACVPEGSKKGGIVTSGGNPKGFGAIGNLNGGSEVNCRELANQIIAAKGGKGGGSNNLQPIGKPSKITAGNIQEASVVGNFQAGRVSSVARESFSLANGRVGSIDNSQVVSAGSAQAQLGASQGSGHSLGGGSGNLGSLIANYKKFCKGSGIGFGGGAGGQVVGGSVGGMNQVDNSYADARAVKKQVSDIKRNLKEFKTKNAKAYFKFVSNLKNGGNGDIELDEEAAEAQSEPQAMAAAPQGKPMLQARGMPAGRVKGKLQNSALKDIGEIKSGLTELKVMDASAHKDLINSL
jgi:hypothetical protein